MKRLFPPEDMIYFAPGWEGTRGCRIKCGCAKEQSVQVMEGRCHVRY